MLETNENITYNNTNTTELMANQYGALYKQSSAKGDRRIALNCVLTLCAL